MSCYTDENGVLIDDEGFPVQEPLDAWEVREQLQNSPRGGGNCPPRVIISLTEC